ncbi:uracil phosphoribosyltransferase [Candidatus Dependentiae bacterium]
MEMKKVIAAAALLSCSFVHSNDWLSESQRCMQNAKQLWATILRNKDTNLVDYRKASEHVGRILAYEAMEHITVQNMQIQTQLAPINGTTLNSPVMIIPVLRSGLTLLLPFMNQFENARVGFVGLRRDEETAKAHWYYENVPTPAADEYVIIIDPMLATGGTALEVLRKLKKYNVKENHIIFATVVCAPEGLEAVYKEFPNITIITVAVDDHLNAKKFIVPGLGDFGDRYFGTE